MMKLYKFRTLGDKESLNRIEEIINTGMFWCSRFWKMNDPMEGVFQFSRNNNTQSVLDILYSQKNKYSICSFSGEKAFQDPSMWGYYANGFKGVAIELDVDAHDDHIREVNYVNSLSYVDGRDPKDSNLIFELLTCKLKWWQQEHEWRHLNEDSVSKQKIGMIRGIHFGLPYGNTENCSSVFKKSRTFRNYILRAEQLIELAKKKSIPCYVAKVHDNKVQSEQIESWPKVILKP